MKTKTKYKLLKAKNKIRKLERRVVDTEDNCDRSLDDARQKHLQIMKAISRVANLVDSKYSAEDIVSGFLDHVRPFYAKYEALLGHAVDMKNALTFGTKENSDEKDM